LSLALDVCIIYFISCDCIMNSSLSYTIYEKNAELDKPNSVRIRF
jgi:hypothetical protein